MALAMPRLNPLLLANEVPGFKKNVFHLLDHEDFELIEHDVINPLPDLEVDQIYNLACPASPPHYQQDPLFTTNTAIFGVINCLELGKKCGARVFQASTSEVYGDPLVHPQPESSRRGGGGDPATPRDGDNVDNGVHHLAQHVRRPRRRYSLLRFTR